MTGTPHAFAFRPQLGLVCVLVLLLVPLAGLLRPLLGQEQESRRQRRPRREVSWVNPKLPESRGLTHHVLTSKALGHDVGYVVWLPPGYEESAPARYPVIYFLHGAGGNESADAGGFSSRVAGAIRKKTMPPVICVFPNGGSSGYRGTVEAMIIEELIPLVDRRYRTLARPESRALAGFSMGGAGSTRLLFTHPELFCAAASWGGGARSGDEALRRAATEHAPVLKKRGVGLLQIKGDRDRPEGNREFAGHLDELGVRNEFVLLEDTPHNLGLYYERSSEKLLEFLSRHIDARPDEPGPGAAGEANPDTTDPGSDEKPGSPPEQG